MRQQLSRSSIVLAEGLTKNFGKVRALDGLDLDVRAGEVHGFLGPNGAGKSTTIRAVLGQLRLDGGRLSVLGRDPRRDVLEIHARLAYVPGDTALWPGLTGGECIDLLGGLHGRQDRRRRDELVERFELDPSRRARTYSKGNRQKVALIGALCLDCELLVLDEPTSGLDPLMESRFQATIEELREQGRTVLLSSHVLDEVEALCDRVTIIRSGRTVSSGSLTQLRSHLRTAVHVTTAAPIPELTRQPGIAGLTAERRGADVQTRFTCRSDVLADVLAVIAHARPTQVSVRPPSLDEVFLEQYRARPHPEHQPADEQDREA